MGTRGAHYKWQFKARFRRNAFGWRSQPAIQRIKEAVSEIKKVARKDALLAAEGAVVFLESLGLWHYRQYGVKALAAMGKQAEAIRFAEGGRGLSDNPIGVARACEDVLLSSGFVDEAIALANRSPCSPQTLTRAARDFAGSWGFRDA